MNRGMKALYHFKSGLEVERILVSCWGPLIHGVMPEVEVKVLGVEVETVVRRLNDLGARQTFDGLVKCVHFDRPTDGLRASGRLFRLRRWEGKEGFPSKFEICFKGPKQVIDGCKVREEVETTVADADQFEKIMASLGYTITMKNEKRRRSFEWNGCHFDLDEYPRVAAYMEIEGAGHVAIDSALEALQLKGAPGVEVSTETAEELFARLWPEVDFDHLMF